jgi:hypothetical protein
VTAEGREPIPLPVEGTDGIFQPVIKKAPPARKSEAAISPEVLCERRPLGRERLPDVYPVPLVVERSLGAAEPELESVADAIVEVAVEQIGRVVGPPPLVAGGMPPVRPRLTEPPSLVLGCIASTGASTSAFRPRFALRSSRTSRESCSFCFVS